MIALFAGRGDVLFGMFLALLVGVWIGWQLKTLYIRFAKPPTDKKV
jgi:uncharacterized membrane protein